jgi:uncharacterized OB-fold protein
MTEKTTGLRLFTCTACGHVFQTERTFCPRCGGTALDHDTAPRPGTVAACTEVHNAPLGAPTGAIPFWIVLVDCDAGPRIMASHGAPATIGARVTVIGACPDRGPYFLTEADGG